MTASTMCFFNMQDGFAESLLRGLRKGILGEQNYNSLRTCNSIKDVKSAFAGTDYEELLKDFNEDDTTTLKNILKQKLSDEIEFMKVVSGPELQKFIQIIRHRYMIDNVITIIECNKNGADKNITKSRMEPLGYLPEINGLINMNMQKIEEIYEDVLIDTEVGCYFFAFLEKEAKNIENKNISLVKDAFKDLTPDKIKMYLKKLWLENFYLFVQELDDVTKELMMSLLEFEADCQAIQVVYNSLSLELNRNQAEERMKAIPFFGKLFPTITKQLIKVTSIEMLRETLIGAPEYFNLVKDVPDPKKMEDFNLQSGLKTLGIFFIQMIICLKK